MRLYLMRHGDALPVGGRIHEDAQRPLSPAGKRQVHEVAEGLKRRGAQLSVIRSSPLVRACETAEIVGEVFGRVLPESAAALAPSASPALIRSLLQQHHATDEILCVAHHPDVTLWVALLTALDPSVCPLFGPASVARIQLDNMHTKAELEWFHTADELRRKNP